MTVLPGDAHEGVKAEPSDNLRCLAYGQLAEEMQTCLQKGDRPDIQALARKYPSLVDEIPDLLSALATLQCLGHVSKHDDRSMTGTDGNTNGQLGDFRILRQVGRGGMGIVYEAEQISLQRRVALKMLPFAAVMDARQLQRFKNEAVAAASLKHPNIVQVYSVGCERGVHYYAMEYVEGQTLAEVIGQLRQLSGLASKDEPAEQSLVSQLTRSLAAGRLGLSLARLGSDTDTADYGPAEPDRDRTLPEGERITSSTAETKREPQAQISTDGTPQTPGFFRSVANWGTQAAEALEHAHQMGVVHRDIKPSNLLIDAKGHLLVTDFGLAQTRTGANLTMTGDLLGTLRYMSPEQAQGNRQVLDHRADIYSLGVTLYELLALRPPFESDDRHLLMHEIVDGDPPLPGQVNHAIPHDLETIVLKAMAAEPQSRYTTAQELADDLQRFLDDEPIRARRASLANRTAKWARRHRAVVCSGAAALAAVIGVVAASAFLLWCAYGRERREHLTAVANASKAQENAANAQKNYEMARRAVKQMLIRVADERLGLIPEMNEVQKRLFEDAVMFNTELIKLSPRDNQAHVDRAQVYARLQEFLEARSDYEKAVEIEPENAKLHYLLSNFLQSCPDATVRDPQGALAHAKRAVELDPEGAGYHSHLASLYFHLGMLTEAWAELTRAANLPHRVAWEYDRTAGVRGLFLVDLETAEADARKAVVLDRTHIGYRWRLATLLCLRGHDEQALEEINQALALPPRTDFDSAIPLCDAVASLYLMRAKIYADREMYSSALPDLDKCFELVPSRSIRYKLTSWGYVSSSAHRLRALARFHLQNYDGALADIARAVELDPGDFSNITCIPPYDVAKCPSESLRQGLVKLANETIEKTKGAAGAYAARGRLYGAFEQPQKALADFQKAGLARQPEIWSTLGQSQYRAGKWRAARSSLEKSMLLTYGGSCVDWYLLAMATWKLGQPEEACRWYDKAVEWREESNSERVYRTTADGTMRQRDFLSSPPPPVELVPPSYSHDKNLRRLRAEAQTVLGVANGPTPEDTEPGEFLLPAQFALKPVRLRSGPFLVSADLEWEPSGGATHYRVTLGDTPRFDNLLVDRTTKRTALSIRTLSPGKEFYWRVAAISRSGTRYNSEGRQSFKTDSLASVSGIEFASDMPCVKAVGYGPVRRDEDLYGGVLFIAGKPYPKGLWIHSYQDERPADIVFDISGKEFAWFKADVGLATKSAGGSLQFQVLVDGKLKAETPVLRTGFVYRSLEVEVKGSKEVCLRVLNGGDGYISDHAAWGFARFVETGARDILQDYQQRQPIDDGLRSLYLAADYWQLGDDLKAHNAYETAVEWIKNNRPDDEELLRFRAAAAELLGIAENAPVIEEQTEKAK